jgi:hypothetical protein
MAQARPNPSTFSVSHRPSRKTHRLRLAPAVAVAVVAVLVLLGARNLDWRESPAMVLGELIGLIAPPVLIVLAGLVLYALWRRLAAR